MSRKIKCIDCFNNRGTLCKVARSEYNLPASKKCSDYDPVAAPVSERKAVALPDNTGEDKVRTFADDELVFRFHV